ncbi:MAG: transferrin receptor-like dimerization domain-containing protein [Bacteroidota bacterium]|nr:transferrin receptor-like dimerization domain-containing protein [Bacteroidota bacterium]
MQRTLLTFITLLAASLTFAQTRPLQGFDQAAAARELNLEAQFDSHLDAKHIDTLIRTLSARPHHVGSPGDKANTELISGLLKSWGFDVKVETFTVLFPTPKERLLEMTAPSAYKAVLAEPPVAGDATSGQTSEQLPTYNCYSADGDVSGELVFVNYGIPEDYDRLERMGISVQGRIVLARYGHSWRGIKPKVAQEHGAIGCIIYSDPKDDGYYQGDVYPKGAYKNEYGVQRGSVLDMPIYPGDPLTPGIGATADAKRLNRKDAASLLKIPVLPISYHDAEPLLRALGGPVAPEEWRGALPITYHVGPGATRVHLRLAFNWDMRPVNDIIARLPGSEWPDEWVIRGNHYDAWVNGASDPLSGQAAMLEEARAIGELVKTGWRPKRTLIYCAWDGEEPGLIGSTEWVETHAEELQQKAVIYINTDDIGRGFLGVEGSHALEPFLNEVARDVVDPQTGISIADRRKARDLVAAEGNGQVKKELLAKKTFSIGALGSGSDYSPFIQHIGVPSCNIGFGGENGGGDYHSIYDSYDDYRRFKDPGFQYSWTLAKTTGRTTLRMADANLLPLDFKALYRTVNGYLNELIALTDQLREGTAFKNQLIREGDFRHAADPTKNLLAPKQSPEVPYLDFSPLQNAMRDLDRSTDRVAATLSGSAGWNDQRFHHINEVLYKAEQRLLSDKGLPRRPWYRHAIYAPGFYTGYGVKTLPGIREAIEQGEWKEAQEQIAVVAGVLHAFSLWIDTTGSEP